ncbi:TetR/AcrR family transcriptional regulator [Streptomyces sp. NBC_00986]|uniref:TetR/AcrR family transcriptional regulator n=1 Tax=Streptomyces sp. NBC_00986 TaxID=2903702 RepID=UPI0038692FAE|nr:TetR/AcrR family transcriptional regulator [Streptomyces sp. NBC_00986]
MRAVRILDATAELLLRHGYRRVTVDDVARLADIGKGTVYLHWKTRDDLFRAVLERETFEAVENLLRALRQDAEAWMPHRLARSYFLAIMSRPLLRAVFLADSELLGKLARPESGVREDRHRLVSQSYFELLAEHGVLHGGLSTEQVTYAFLATLEGFIQAEATADDRQGPGIHDRSELLAVTVQRAFEAGHRVPPAAAKTIATQVIDLFARLADADRADLGIGDV